MSILIVDDNAMNARILEVNLAKNGYRTVVASNGPAALECLEAMPEIQLVISDIMMPEMDGLELLARIKQRPEWQNIPIIMCTALSNVETVRKAAKAGCRNYVVKPIKAVQLIQKVRQILGHEEVILKDKAKILVELGIELDVYNDLARAFRTLVADTVAMLEKGPPLPETLDLLNLLESASLMGAEKVARILDAKLARDPGDPDYALLLRELKVLYIKLSGDAPKAMDEPEKNEAARPEVDDQAAADTKEPSDVAPSTTEAAG